MSSDVQELLENDLTCAICQDIYINPLILNCSHSFCKFCVYKWLSKKTGCPTCRMTVSFQAENLALRNIINRMVLKSSTHFQSIRTNNVNQRLKDEEEQEKDGTTRLLLKDPSVSPNGQRPRTSRYRLVEGSNNNQSNSRRSSSILSRVFPGMVDLDGDIIINSDDSSTSSAAPSPDLGFFHHYLMRGNSRGSLWYAGHDDESESDDEDFSFEEDDDASSSSSAADADDDDDEDAGDEDNDENDNGGLGSYLYSEDADEEDDDDNDVTFEIESDSSSDSDSASSLGSSSHIVSDEDFVDLDVTGTTDSDDSSDEDDDDDDDDDNWTSRSRSRNSPLPSSSSSSSSDDDDDDDSDTDNDNGDDNDNDDSHFQLPEWCRYPQSPSGDTESDDSIEEWPVREGRNDDSMTYLDRYSGDSTIEYGTDSDESLNYI